MSENVRPDGREKDQWRDVRINVGMLCAKGDRFSLDRAHNPVVRRRVDR